MSKLRILLSACAFLVLSLGFAASARGQATRTFISGIGNDADPCSRTAPCRTWAGALLKTFVNGEINALDPGGFGTANITKSIMLDGNGTHASTLASGANGIIVNIAAGNANDPHRSVRLRNLSINGTGPSGTVGTRTGLDGIRFISGSSLFVEHVLINDFSLDGIDVSGPVGEGNAMLVVLDDVEIRNVNGSGFKAAHANAAGQILASLNNVRVSAANIGIEGTNRSRIAARDSVVNRCPTGFRQTGQDNIMNLDNISASYATTGLLSSTGNTMRVSNSFITQNGTGLNPNSGTITSLSGNSVFGNTVDGAFTGAAVPKT
jgi:hypothetical protein